MIVGLHHVAVGLPDFDAALAFYRYGTDPFGNIIELDEIRDPEVAQLRRD